jgi:membrane protein DedA with SNARE-associated domain
MLDSLEQIILSALQTIFDQFGWWGVFGLMVFENATGITPAEIILAFAGWMLIERHGISPTFIPLGGFYAALGSTLGASITYWVARKGGRPLVDRFAKFFRIDLRLIERVEAKCREWRVLPGVRPLVSIPAGLVRIPFHKFFLATFAGAYVWCTFLIGAGYVLGVEWRLISDYVKTHVPLVFAVVALVAVGLAVYHYRTALWKLIQPYTRVGE